MHKGKGLFITFEGGEGAGKTTQIELLKKILEGQHKDVVLTREPGGSPGAEDLRQLVVKGDVARWDPVSEAMIFCAARRDHLVKTIFPAIKQGKIVICDRFADSTMAYQGYGAETDKDRQKMIPMIETLYHFVAEDFKPDLTVFLDVPVEVGLARSRGRCGNDEQRFEDKKESYHRRVHEGFLDIVKNDPERFIVVDATQPANKVSQDILNQMALRGFFLKIQQVPNKGIACKPSSRSK